MIGYHANREEVEQLFNKLLLFIFNNV
jgi:hypothetical protein